MKPIDEKTAPATLNFSNCGICSFGLSYSEHTRSTSKKPIVKTKWKKDSIMG